MLKTSLEICTILANPFLRITRKHLSGSKRLQSRGILKRNQALADLTQRKQDQQSKKRSNARTKNGPAEQKDTQAVNDKRARYQHCVGRSPVLIEIPIDRCGPFERQIDDSNRVAHRHTCYAFLLTHRSSYVTSSFLESIFCRGTCSAYTLWQVMLDQRGNYLQSIYHTAAERKIDPFTVLDHF